MRKYFAIVAACGLLVALVTTSAQARNWRRCSNAGTVQTSPTYVWNGQQWTAPAYAYAPPGRSFSYQADAAAVPIAAGTVGDENIIDTTINPAPPPIVIGPGNITSDAVDRSFGIRAMDAKLLGNYR